MRMRQVQNKGEFILLGVFTIFTLAYLIEINDLPIEGKILSYLLAPFIFSFLSFCFYRSFPSTKGEKNLQKEETFFLHGRKENKYRQDQSGLRDRKSNENKEERRLYNAIALSFILFLGIFFLGFYFGSGFMLLAWFLVFKKFNIKTLSITVATPLLLYVIFELLISFGLYEGLIFLYINQ